MGSILGHITILVFGLVLLSAGSDSVQRINKAELADLKQHEQLYLPSGKGLHFLSLGYKNALADLLWFKTISYFGKHYATDKNYEWLAHMCDLVTTLDSKALHVYEFGALMLAWEAENPLKANQLLDKAIDTPELRNHPEFWRMYYIHGVNNTFFLSDPAAAAEDFAAGAKLPHTDPIMARLASKKLLNLGKDAEEAIRFLEDAILMTRDQHAREALEKRLREARRKLKAGDNQ